MSGCTCRNLPFHRPEYHWYHSRKEISSNWAHGPGNPSSCHSWYLHTPQGHGDQCTPILHTHRQNQGNASSITSSIHSCTNVCTLTHSRENQQILWWWFPSHYQTGPPHLHQPHSSDADCKTHQKQKKLVYHRRELESYKYMWKKLVSRCQLHVQCIKIKITQARTCIHTQ